ETKVKRADNSEENDERQQDNNLLTIVGKDNTQRQKLLDPIEDGGGRTHKAASASARPLTIAAPTDSDVTSPRSIRAAMRPPLMTSTRSLMPRTSGSSLEIIRIAMPSPASFRMRRWISALAPTSIPRVGSSM